MTSSLPTNTQQAEKIWGVTTVNSLQHVAHSQTQLPQTFKPNLLAYAVSGQDKAGTQQIIGQSDSLL